MKTLKKTFLVLVPHRDIRLALRRYSDSLFREGFYGAYHFPWSAPLAALSRPLNNSELKYFARSLRDAASGEKLNAAEASSVSFPLCENDGSSIFGPQLDICVTQNSFGSAVPKIAALFSPAVIGTCLLSAAEAARPAEISAMPVPPQLSFRAAAVANMYWQPVQISGISSGGEQAEGAFGCKWKIGKLCWLPPVEKNVTLENHN